MKQIIFALLTIVACTSNPYKDASPEKIKTFKEVSVPFPSGTNFTISMAPYHTNNRHYSWNFDVPFGTPVHAIESGKVIFTSEPEGGGGCDRTKFLNKGHIIRVLHDDGTLAQYLHVAVKVKKDDLVKKGQLIALTANNGVVCTPQLHIMVFADRYNSRQSGETIPLRFIGIPGGIALPGYKGTVP